MLLEMWAPSFLGNMGTGIVRRSHLTSSLVVHSCSCVEPGGEVGVGNGANGQSSIDPGCGLALC